MRRDAGVVKLCARSFTIPTDAPEADGSASWTSTTMGIVHANGGGRRGLGYTYTDASVVGLINGKLAPLAVARDTMDPTAARRAMQEAMRNLGRDDSAATAISAVDVALWDLKSALLDLLSSPCSAATVTSCRTTAAAASQAMATLSLHVNSPGGWSATAAAG
jgi:L-alanine-DL-glutamate epimerase-like enolase superfamily enzyme